MSNTTDALSRKRQALIEQAARQRLEFREACVPLEKPLRVADTVIGVSRNLKQHRWILTLATTLLSTLILRRPPLRATAPSTIQRVSQLWQAATTVYGLWQRFRR